MAIRKKPLPVPIEQDEVQLKDFFDLVSPSTNKFNVDHYIVGDSFRSVWAIREYPPTTSDQAILCRFGDKESVTLHLYSRYVDSSEQRKIIQNATRKNRMMSGGTDIQDTVTAEGNLEDVVELLSNMRKNKEPLLHSTCSYRSRERPNRKSIKKNVTPANFMSSQYTLRCKRKTKHWK